MNRGFTLIELLVVIAIIGLLAAVVLPRLNSARDKSLVAQAQLELEGIVDAMVLLYDDTSNFPNGANSLCRTTIPGNNEVDLSSNGAGLLANGGGWNGWNGPYLQDVEDAWGNPYFLDEDYECNGGEVGCSGTTDTISAVLSCGPDGDMTGAGGSCVYNDDNIVLRLCN